MLVLRWYPLRLRKVSARHKQGIPIPSLPLTPSPFSNVERFGADAQHDDGHNAGPQRLAMVPCSADAKQHWVGRGKGGRGNAYEVARQTVGPYWAGLVARRFRLYQGETFLSRRVLVIFARPCKTSCKTPCKTLLSPRISLQDVI